jgi:RNA polymerase sigma-70 factor (ECF subfamily)
LLNYFHRMLWHDRERARDFLQDLFTKLAQRPASYDPSRPFQTWLFSVANNMCKNAYRHDEVVRAAAVELRHNADDRVEALDGRGVDRELFRGRLDEELGKLDPDHKATFVMRYHEDMAIKEIAAAFSCSEGTVKSRLFYTLKKLAERMKEFDPKTLEHGAARTLRP